MVRLAAALLLAALLAACSDDTGEERGPGAPPPGPVAGTVDGIAFRPDLVRFVDGTLVFGNREYAEPYLVVALRGVPEPPLELRDRADEPGPSIEVTVKTEDDLLPRIRTVATGYVLDLRLANGSGTVDLVVPGEPEARLAGRFDVEVPPPVRPDELPVVRGRIDHPVRDARCRIAVGYLGEKDAGGWLENERAAMSRSPSSVREANA